MSDTEYNEPEQILYHLYEEVSKEKNDIVKELHTKQLKIEEIENHLNSISEKEDTDYQLFSPRNTESLYKEKKEQLLLEKELLEKEKFLCEQQVVKENSKIGYIKKLLDCYYINNSITDNTKQESFIQSENYKTLDIKEKEQQRIARDLHDSALQMLTHIIHKIELLSKFITQDPIRAKLEAATVIKHLKEVVQEIRNTIFDLHPMSFDDLGLKESLENLFTLLQQEKSIEIEYDIDIKECKDYIVLINVFHIVQECVTNAFKHSEGTKVLVSIKEEDTSIHIIVEDNGKGFDVDKVIGKVDRHFGLSILNERIDLLNGNIAIQSEIGKGTLIQIDLKSK